MNLENYEKHCSDRSMYVKILLIISSVLCAASFFKRDHGNGEAFDVGSHQEAVESKEAILGLGAEIVTVVII